jgi:hypothetical protein
MADWPSIANANLGSSGELYKPQVRNEFEANYVQSRPRASREIRRFPLRWNCMSEADFSTLETFFIANQGGEFNYTDPRDSTAYVCRFSMDSILWDYVEGGRRVECPIEEV